MVKKDMITAHRSEESDVPAKTDEARLTEIAYHKKFNRSIVIFGSVFFVFFTVFHFSLGNYFQSFIFALLLVNALFGLWLGYRIETLDGLVLAKRIGTGIAFGLLGISLIAGVLSGNIYIFFSWIFFYPVAVTLMLGKRAGLAIATGYCVLMIAAVFYAQFSPLDESKTLMLKYNSALALLGLLGVGFTSEKARVRVQGELLAAQSKYREAERHQREINAELQQEIDLRIRSEKALAQSELRYRALFEESTVSLWEEDWEPLKKFIDALPDEAKSDLESYFKNNPEVLWKCVRMVRTGPVNRATLELYEADSQEMLMENFNRILPKDADKLFGARIASLYKSGRFDAEVSGQTISGRPLYLLFSSTIPAGFETSWARVYTSLYDNTERVLVEAEKNRVQQQLQSARQIQAVATLAGGVAHEFNNALAVIFGNLDLLEFQVHGDERFDDIVLPLKAATDEIAHLTEKLLAYARGGKYQPKEFSVNELIQSVLSTEKMMPPSHIRVQTELAENICMTRGDITQIRMVLEAVISNALESISDKGKIIITTENYDNYSNTTHQTTAIPEGRYTSICVQDNGVGMDEKTVARIFEPFFTTKIYGRGMGMAAAFGVVSNHKGMIAVTSKPHHGTRVMIYLPEFIK